MPLVVPGVTHALGSDSKSLEWLTKLAGKTLSDDVSNETTFIKKELPEKTRILKHDEVPAVDQDPERLNVVLQKDGTVSKVYFG